MTCTDQTPQALIPKLVQKIGLPGGDEANPRHTVFYRLRLDSEQGPALHTKALLSRQNVADGKHLWLVPEFLTQEHDRVKHGLLRLPDGSAIVLSARGHGLARTWLLGFLQLLNPAAYAHEVERFEQYQSPYRYVSDKRPHCYIRLSDDGDWVVTTDRADVMTECATTDTFELISTNVLVRLRNGMRIRLGGVHGLELGVVLL
jgi:hypothetical protein